MAFKKTRDQYEYTKSSNYRYHTFAKVKSFLLSDTV
jgi:hypothetical protein